MPFRSGFLFPGNGERLWAALVESTNRDAASFENSDAANHVPITHNLGNDIEELLDVDEGPFESSAESIEHANRFCDWLQQEFISPERLIVDVTSGSILFDGELYEEFKNVDGLKMLDYRIARFKTLRRTDTPANVPHDFDLREYFGDAWTVFRGEKKYHVEIEFPKDAADLVLETTWHATQEVQRQKDGSVRLRFRVDGLSEIVHWVLSWSGRAKVIQPLELRELVVSHLRSAIELNQA